MPNIDLSILNQRQTPAFFADTLANRPAAGFLGRIFVSTDTFAFYRDNGTGWDLIGGPGTGTITGSGAAGQVTFFNGTSSITGDSGLTYNDVTNALTSLGTIKATNYYVGTPSDLTRAFAAKGDASSVALWLEEYGNTSASPDIFMFKGQGSSATPSNVLVNDSTSSIASGGYVNGILNSTSVLSTKVVNIDSVNNQADSDLILLQTYNSLTLTENFRVRSIDGYVVASNGGFETTGNINLFAGANTRRIVFDANNGVPRIFSFRTGNLPRWAFRVDGTESGTNTGSDLAIRRYDDTGAFVDAPLSINRASGESTFSKKVVIVNNTNDQQLQIVSTTAPSIRIDNLQTGATKRAGLGISTAANNFIQGSVDRDFCIFNGSTTASPMLFGIYDAGTSNIQEAARISAARNLLIGTTSDNGNKLQINGNSSINGGLRFYDFIGATTNFWEIYHYNDNTLRFNYNGVGNDEIIIDSNGTTKFINDITIGNSNSKKIYGGAVGSSSFIELYNGSTGDMTFYNNYITGRINFCTANNATPKFVINSNGNTLIGSTTDSGQRLQVTGMTYSGISYRAGSYTQGDTTPSVDGISFLPISNTSPTTITNFTSGSQHQVITLYFSDSNTTIDRTNCYLSGGVNFTSTASDTITLINNGGFWYEVSRSINS